MRLPNQLHLIMKSYLSECYFQVKIDELSDYHPITAGDPQGSVLGPFPYLISTVEISLTNNALMTKFTDTVIIIIIPLNLPKTVATP